MAALRNLARLFALSLGAAGSVACSAAPTPSAEEVTAAATADEGAFEAFDEACLGVGDLEASLPEAIKKGWVEFTPAKGSMLDKHKKMLLDGPAFDRPDVVFLRKNSNRAEIVMGETTTLLGSDYIFNCEVVEASAASLDLEALKEWSKVPIKERQIDDSPVYFELIGGRFASGAGGAATAYFANGDDPQETLAGLIVATLRSSFPEEGTE